MRELQAAPRGPSDQRPHRAMPDKTFRIVAREPSDLRDELSDKRRDLRPSRDGRWGSAFLKGWRRTSRLASDDAADDAARCALVRIPFG